MTGPGHQTFEVGDYQGIISYVSNGEDLKTSIGRRFVINKRG